MKFCPGCSLELPRREFGKNVSRPDGLQSYCRTCQRAKYKQYTQRVRERNASETEREAA